MTRQTSAGEITGNTAKPAGKRKGFFLLLAFIIVLAMLSRREPVDTIDCSPEIIAAGPAVIMLGAWWCSYCYQAKKYFQKNDISYCEYDVENTATGRQLYEKHGSGAVPILLIGEYQLNGFSEQQIEQALSLLNNNLNRTQ